MSLPPGFLDELRTRTSLSQVAGRKLMWDQRKSNQGKGDMWAPCPFHQEKTASFHVDDRKGFYYCFGCHAKGDAISFVRETENVGFMEAVEILAREVGMPMPARDPKAQEKSDRRSQLADVMEQAVQYYRLQLKASAGGAARDYLAGRGLDEGAQDRWEIGFAPDARQGVFRHLKDKGVDDQLIIDAGLCAKPDDGAAPYDRFRGRIIFPIRDARGRAIALGGRAMDPNARAKYLNSPETMLFDKGRSLFNLRAAREAAGKGQPLIVAEGYMDVIALSEAGFGACVAPLGTAITENQLQMLWRVAPEPVITLDGDTAGQRAAMRLIDLALPQLEAGQSLRFATMPQGMDPDDLLKAQGAGAMQKLVDEAQPLVNMLWKKELEAAPTNTPEQKAGLDKRLREAISRIKDRYVRQHYGETIKQYRWETFRPKNWSPEFRPGRRNRKDGATNSAKQSMLARDHSVRVFERIQEMIVVAICIRVPDVVQLVRPSLEDFEFLENQLQAVMIGVLQFSDTEEPEQIISGLAELGFGTATGNIFAEPHIKTLLSLNTLRNMEFAKLIVAEQLAKLSANRAHRQEMSDAAEDFDGLIDEGLTWRLTQSSKAVHAASLGGSEDKAEFEVAGNGMQLSKEERDRLDTILSRLNVPKGKTPG